MRRILGILIRMIPSVTTAMSRQMPVAHELAHGTNALHHTFSPESETFYTTSKTDNLMDYNGGKYLNHSQWQWSHEKLQSIDENKIVVDDPYGKVKGKADGFEHRQKCNSGGYEKNNKTSEGAAGNNNEWYWDDIENVTIKYVESYERD